MSEGWVCPKCGSVYAPGVLKCWNCPIIVSSNITCELDKTCTCDRCGETYMKYTFHYCKGIKYEPDNNISYYD